MRIVVVGLGSMGKRRIRILRHLFSAVEAEIIGVDTQLSRREEVETAYQIHCTASLDEALGAGKTDCGLICTSPRGHYAVAKKLLERGISVFSEINLINEHHRNLIALAKEHQAHCFLSSTPLYSQDRRYLTETVNNASNISYCYHVGQYLPDWHPWESYEDFFVGDRCTNACREIFVIELPWLLKTFGELETLSVSRKKSTSLKINYPDTYMLTLTHKNGNMGSLCVDVVSRVPVRSLTVFNEELYLVWQGRIDAIQQFDIQSGKLQPVELQGVYRREAGYAEFINEMAYVDEIKAFFDCCNGKTQPLHTVEDDISLLELVDGIEGLKE